MAPRLPAFPLYVLIGIVIGNVTGCQNGWTTHGESCYLFIKEQYNWFNAQMACQILGGHLVEINTATENNYVHGLVRAHGGQSVWIGLDDISEEGVFVLSSTRESPDQTFWLPDQPDDYNRKEDCARMVENGLWDDNQCQSAGNEAVCERPNSSGDIIG